MLENLFSILISNSVFFGTTGFGVGADTGVWTTFDYYTYTFYGIVAKGTGINSPAVILRLLI
jgi:hypothetical protein